MLPERFTPELFRKLELLKLRSRRSYLGTRQGGHLSLKKGHGIEFSDYRQYEPGDNPRHIDWGLYGRSDRLYVKRFQEEQNLTVLLLVDGSASMMTPPEDGKWEYARDLALALAYVALMQQDSVTASVLGQMHSPLYSGAQGFHQIVRQMTEGAVGRQGDFGGDAKGALVREAQSYLVREAQSCLVREAQRAVARVRFPGVAVFVSDFLLPLEEIEQIISILRAKNLDVTAVQVLGEHDLQPFAINTDAIAVDSETGEEVSISLTEQSARDYKEFLDQHINSVRRLFLESRIGFCQTSTEDDFSQFVMQSLARTGLLQ